jgi:hypothetical protein
VGFSYAAELAEGLFEFECAIRAIDSVNPVLAPVVCQLVSVPVCVAANLCLPSGTSACILSAQACLRPACR